MRWINKIEALSITTQDFPVKIKTALSDFRCDLEKYIKAQIYEEVHDKVSLKLFNSELDQMVTISDHKSDLETIENITLDFERNLTTNTKHLKKEIQDKLDKYVQKTELKKIYHHLAQLKKNPRAPIQEKPAENNVKQQDESEQQIEDLPEGDSEILQPIISEEQDGSFENDAFEEPFTPLFENKVENVSQKQYQTPSVSNPDLIGELKTYLSQKLQQFELNIADHESKLNDLRRLISDKPQARFSYPSSVHQSPVRVDKRVDKDTTELMSRVAHCMNQQKTISRKFTNMESRETSRKNNMNTFYERIKFYMEENT